MAYVTDLTKAELAFVRTLSLIDGEENFKVKRRENGSHTWIDGSLTFENVVFRYPKRKRHVLNGCSFHVPTGTTIGITGGFGSGKTTLLSLIQRFYDPTEGRILVDGEDIQDINVGHLRTNLGYVPTEPDLFHCTIEENISYGYCGEVEGPGLRVLVQEVVEIVNLKKLLERHLDGYSSMVQPEGIGLSTMEKRKIAICRALIRAPQILLIDEPMVGLAASDEMEMLELIEKIKVGRTCIVTTARVELLQKTDKVAVLRGGKILECGTQEELKAIPNGHYSSLLATNDFKALATATITTPTPPSQEAPPTIPVRSVTFEI